MIVPPTNINGNGTPSSNGSGGSAFKPVPPPKPKNYRPPVQGSSGSSGLGAWENGVSISFLQIFFIYYIKLIFNRNLVLPDLQMIFTIHLRLHIIIMVHSPLLAPMAVYSLLMAQTQTITVQHHNHMQV